MLYFLDMIQLLALRRAFSGDVNIWIVKWVEQLCMGEEKKQKSGQQFNPNNLIKNECWWLGERRLIVDTGWYSQYNFVIFDDSVLVLCRFLGSCSFSSSPSLFCSPPAGRVWQGAWPAPPLAAEAQLLPLSNLQLHKELHSPTVCVPCCVSSLCTFSILVSMSLESQNLNRTIWPNRFCM